MALSATAAQVNADITTLIADWEAHIDSLTQGDQIIVVPVAFSQLSVPHSRWGNDANTLVMNFSRQMVFTRELVTADLFPTHVGKHPLFWKITNAARDLT